MPYDISRSAFLRVDSVPCMPNDYEPPRQNVLTPFHPDSGMKRLCQWAKLREMSYAILEPPLPRSRGLIIFEIGPAFTRRSSGANRMASEAAIPKFLRPCVRRRRAYAQRLSAHVGCARVLWFIDAPCIASLFAVGTPRECGSGGR